MSGTPREDDGPNAGKLVALSRRFEYIRESDLSVSSRLQ